MPSLRLCSAALAATLSLSSTALAAPTPKERAEARTAAAEGRKALKDKRWADAMTALKKADKLDPGAGVELDLAQAQIGAGKLIEAQKTLTATAAGTENTPAARKAREAAKKLLADLGTRIPKVSVKVKGPTGKSTVSVDGVEVDGSAETPVNPGSHTIGASAEGFASAEREVRFEENVKQELVLELTPSKPAVVEKKSGSRVPGAVVTALGGAGLLVGGIFGGLAFTATNTAKSKCAGNVCPPQASDDISRSKLYGNVSTGAFIAGGAVAVTGIVLLIVAPGGGGEKSDDAKSARVTPWIGPGGAGLVTTGRF